MIKNLFSVMMAVLAVILCEKYVDAQVTQQWAKIYSGPASGSDYVVKVLADPFSESVYTLVNAYASPANFDIALIKYNSSGVVQWVKTYNGTAGSGDYGRDMTFDAIGNIVITGASTVTGSGLDYITIKYDHNGNRLWVKKYNGTANGHDIALAIASDVEGSVTVTGQSMGRTTQSNNDDIVTIKYDYYGNQLWTQRYNGTDNLYDQAYSIVTDYDNNIYITGATSGLTNLSNYITIKYSPQGTTEWVRKYETDGNDDARKILRTPSGQICVIGSSLGTTKMICYSSSGSVVWENNDYGALTTFSSAVIDNAGNLVICGNSTASGTNDYMIIGYNSLGNLAYVNTYNGEGAGNDYTSDIANDYYGNTYVTGYSKNAGTGYDLVTVKFNQNGVMQWNKKYNTTGTGTNIGVSVSVNNSGKVFVSGTCQNTSSTYDGVTIKYTQGGVLGRDGSELPVDFRLQQNYPNPFNPSTTIKFDLPSDAAVRLAVYDMVGKEVQLLADENMQAGSYEFNFDASQLSSGTYFYQLKAASYSDIKKMILVK